MRVSVLARTLGIPGFLVLLVILMYVFAGQFAYRQVMGVREKVASLKKEENILKLKLATLAETQNSVAGATEGVAIALPLTNPSLVAFSQLKKVAAANQITLSNLSVGAELKEAALSKVIVAIDADGSLASLLSFLKALETIAPLAKLEKIKITGGGIARASVSTSFFWAEAPKTITAVGEGLTNLTPEEQKTLQFLTSLAQPDIGLSLPSQVSPGVRSNPF